MFDSKSTPGICGSKISAGCGDPGRLSMYSNCITYPFEQANGWRYVPSGVLVGGTRQYYFIGTNYKPCRLLENAAPPTTPVPPFFGGGWAHAVLGVFVEQDF